MDGPHVHFRPEALETLCQLTAFSRKELQVMYRSFKQEAPSGVLREETFKHIFAQFFPGADSGQYAHYVWSTTLDPEKAGVVTFTDFVIGLSVLSRGSLQDKLRWTFSLYDVNGDGIITKDDLSRIVIAVYDLLGKAVDPAVDENTYRDHIDKVFAKFDLNDDGVVTLDEFVTVCTQVSSIVILSIVLSDLLLSFQDKTIARSFDVFTTTNLL